MEESDVFKIKDDDDDDINTYILKIVNMTLNVWCSCIFGIYDMCIVTLFHAKLGLNICLRVNNQPVVLLPLVDQSPSGLYPQAGTIKKS